MTRPAPGRAAEAPPAPHAERLEFVAAFVEHGRAKPSPDRLVARPHIALLVASVAAIGALLYGLVVSLFTSGGGLTGGTAPAAAASPTVKPGPSSYTAVTGWDCRSAPDHVFEATGRTAAWSAAATGAWTQDGCTGGWAAIPMTGDASADDPGQSAVWAFQPGTGVGKCAVAVYAPKLDGKVTAATKASFTVSAGRDGEQLGTFTMNEATRSGDWLEAGTFPVSNGKFTVKLGTRGKPDEAKQRLIAAQIRITCAVADK